MEQSGQGPDEGEPDETPKKDDELAEQIRRSTQASGVPEKVEDQHTLHALAALFRRAMSRTSN